MEFNSVKEEEKVAYAFLKMIRYAEKEPSFLKKYTRKRKVAFWEKYAIMYGDNFANLYLHKMINDNILDVENLSRKYILSKKGKMMYKRGWVYYETKWYDEDAIRKYTTIISVLALIVAIIGNDNILSAILYIANLLNSIL